MYSVRVHVGMFLQSPRYGTHRTNLLQLLLARCMFESDEGVSSETSTMYTENLLSYGT